MSEFFKHKYLRNVTCVIIGETKKGYKVTQTETYQDKKKPKIKTAFYDKIDFDKDKGIWIK